VSDLNDFTPDGLPVIEHRFFSSVVQLANGQPMLLSGIKRTADVKTVSGVPWLRDLPWAGYLFGREVTTKSEKELVVVLTPRFKLCPTDEPAPPASLIEGIKLVRGEDPLEVPDTDFGFDQWLLD
jgi:Flp pilus assembly secretin CpaC